MEASLAFQGIDFRDLWRRGSGMSLRRLNVLLRGLPHGSPLHEAIWTEHEAAQKAKPDEIRDRQAEWERRNAERLAKEAG